MDIEFSSSDTLEGMLQDGSSGPRSVSLEYLRNITNNFADDMLIGEGGFGTLYEGVLPNGVMVAVKRLNSSMLPGVKDEQFENEAHHLMRLKHPNIVLLLSRCSETENIYVEYNGKPVCAEKSERLLCLEYMPKGNLRGYLSDESSGLTWKTRYKIIEGICCGLKCLHEESQLNAPIVHMDLKPENILLDDNMVPKIANFGLSILLSEEETITTSRVGTRGFMAPEYINRGIISTKSDIFSLGVIILEILTGHRDYPNETGGITQQFTEFVLEKWRRRLQNSPRYTSLEIDCQQIRRCIQIGLDCVKLDRHKRPTISQVIKMLQETASAVQIHPTLIDDNNLVHSLGSHGFRVEPQVMPLELLREITNDFSEKERLGKGTFGTVYKGVLNGKEVAVKLLHSMSQRLDYEKDFKKEFDNLRRLNHPNIVQLLGYCYEVKSICVEYEGKYVIADKTDRALCFDYMHNGNLQRHLDDESCGLDWQTRYKIIKGTCEGLKYLHKGLENPMFHLDLKPGNILLDKNMVPKLADFGLSKLVCGNQTQVTSNFLGTIRYCPPEHIERHLFSNKFDIFSLGVIMIEIIAGVEGYRKAVEMSSKGFIDHVQENWRKRIHQTTPGCKLSTYEFRQVKRCIEIALECVHTERMQRPDIEDIITRLNETESNIEKSATQLLPLKRRHDTVQ